MKHPTQKLLFRRLTALLLGILLVPSLLPVQAAFADEPDGGETQTPVQPDMRVIATLVNEKQYLEVGLNIDSKEGGTFQSAGVLLTYDPTILTPVTWDAVGVPMGIRTVPESTLAWEQTALLLTKGADEMSGKLSAAVGVEGKSRGYLFLSAETAMPMCIYQPEPIGDSVTDAPTATANSHPVTCIAKTETATQQTVVVRFQINEKPPQGGEELGTRELQGYTLAELVSSLDLVNPEQDGAEISIFPLTGSAGLSYLADNNSIETTGFETPANLSFVWILDGVSVNTAGAASGATSGLDINLAGGRWKDSDTAAAKAFEDAAAALKKGETLTLPEIEPSREGGYTFVGWTLGERDSDGRLILYRHSAAVVPPEESETVTVTWKNGETGATIDHTFTSAPKGYTVMAKDCPEPPADIDKDAEGDASAVHKTFDKWEQSVDGTTGNITMTAVFKDKLPVTYVWVDPLREEEDKTVQTVADSYIVPVHPAAPDHGEDHPFKEWVMGEPVEADGVTTVTFTAAYKTLITYKWVDAEGAPILADEVPVTRTSYDPPAESDYPAAPAVEGKDFKGWEVGQPVTEEDGTITVTITATYGQKTTYIWVDDQTGDTVQTIADQFEKPEDPEAPVHEGWTFQGWIVGEPVTGGDGTVTVTITATYEMDKWTVRDTLPAIQTLPASLAAVWGGGTGGSGGGGLAVNLAGGHWATEDESAGQSFTADCAALQPGSSITIPELTPVRETYSFLGWTLGEIDPETHLVVTYSAGQSVQLGNEASSLAAVWNSTTEGVLAITAYDWDGVTLGSFVFRADSNPTTQGLNAQQALDEFKARPEVAAKLAAKPGYDFLTWVKNESSIPSSYGKRVNSSANTELKDLDLAPEDQADFATLTESTTVKAAYTTNDTIILGEGLSSAEARDARQYTTSIDSYGRFGTGNSFAVRIKVERGNVPRVTEGSLRVRMSIGGADIYSQYALSGADVEVIEVAPYAQAGASGVTGATIVEWTIIDGYGEPNWVGAAPRTTLEECRSAASFTTRDVGTSRNQRVWDQGTYPFEGVIVGINDALASYHALKLENPDLTPSNANMGGITIPILRTIGIPPKAIAAARAALYDKYVENGAQPLDYRAMYEAASGQAMP